MEGEYKYKKIVTVLLSTEKDEGYLVDYKVVQSRSKDNENWEAREVSTTGYSKTQEKAFDIAASEMLFYLNSVNGDLFTVEEVQQWNKTM